ncbi:MAG: hypothetical protein CVU61_09505 [Deltaproteobacteria bacterium HGW-Deltaproteobacteria-19]|jgi:hypothetical protein|nr:MAG: hypothetical protein CVU61_09505 [Deltaproteobacteria bacterium HGW-Deltaproteobacteria-19]
MKKTGEATAIQTENGTMVMEKAAMNSIETALYQIHGLADLLDEAAQNFTGTVKNETSDPLSTLAMVIREKAEYCLGQIPDFI